MDRLIYMVPPTLPSGKNCWPSTPQEFLNDVFPSIQVILDTSNFTYVIYGSTTPSPDQRNYLWYRLSNTPKLQGLYRYYGGAGGWVKEHPFQDSDDFRMMWMGDPANIATLDGGDTGLPGLASGPMWAIDTAFEGRSPMGVGAIPSSDPAKSLTLSESYGAGSHDLTNAEMHNVTVLDTLTGFKTNLEVGPSQWFAIPGAGIGSLSLPATTTTATPSSASTATDKLNMVHPVIGCYFLKRTSRRYYFGGP